MQSIQLLKLEHTKDTYIMWIVISSESKDDGFSIQNEMDIDQGTICACTKLQRHI